MAQRVQEIVICESCTLSRIKRKGVSKQSSHIKATAPNERVYIDISTIRHAGGEEVTKGVCIGVVDEYSSHGTLLFVTAKGRLPATLCELFAQWKGTGRPVKYVRCDNAGENKAFETMSNKGVWQLALVFEYTAARTYYYIAVTFEASYTYEICANGIQATNLVFLIRPQT